jgi:hypothetical protein
LIIRKNKETDTVLLSHAANRAVPSAIQGLTSVFGMGTGISPALSVSLRPFLFKPVKMQEKTGFMMELLFFFININFITTLCHNARSNIYIYYMGG